LIGLEILAIRFSGQNLLAGLFVIPVTLIARFVAVWFPSMLLKGSYSI